MPGLLRDRTTTLGIFLQGVMLIDIIRNRDMKKTLSLVEHDQTAETMGQQEGEYDQG